MTGERSYQVTFVIDVSSWPGLEVIEPASGGSRSEVWRAAIGSLPVAVRRSRRSAASLEWELDLMDHLGRIGFRVPEVVPTYDGRRWIDGVVVQQWLEGRPPSSEADWHAVAGELIRLHGETEGHSQRPGCCPAVELRSERRSVDADLDRMPADIVSLVVGVFDQLANIPSAVVHGDPCAGNIRIGPDGSVGLLDWDESRVDLTWHDLSNLAVQVLDDLSHRQAQRLSDAWEVVNGWVTEPDYAQRRLSSLLDE